MSIKNFFIEMKYWIFVSKSYGNFDMRLEVVSLAFWYYLKILVKEK